MSIIQKPLLLGVVALLIVGSIAYLELQKPKIVAPQEIPETQAPLGENISATSTALGGAPQNLSPQNLAAIIAEKKAKYPRAVEIANPSGFVNAAPFKIADLVGKKVILVDFWTYSCINCQRTLPYITAWDSAYRDQGLAVVGIHTPEFEFEKKYENVKAAVERFGVKYPVVQDNDYGTWRAYGNQYWPHKYLIDIDGFIVYDHIGEGSYDITEKKIQELLAERAVRLGVEMKNSGGLASGKVKGVAVGDVQSPETYFGAARNEFLGNGTPGRTGVQTFTIPAAERAHALYLGGTWDFQNEFAENKSSGARILYKYHARNVYFVGDADVPVKIRVLRDGKDPMSAAGSDVSRDAQGAFITVKDSRLYKIIEDTDYGTHTLELIIESPGMRAFTFTFG